MICKTPCFYLPPPPGTIPGCSETIPWVWSNSALCRSTHPLDGRSCPSSHPPVPRWRNAAKNVRIAWWVWLNPLPRGGWGSTIPPPSSKINFLDLIWHPLKTWEGLHGGESDPPHPGRGVMRVVSTHTHSFWDSLTALDALSTPNVYFQKHNFHNFKKKLLFDLV